MRLATALLALLVTAPSLAAQVENPFMLEPGDRIRLAAPAPSDAAVEADVVDVSGTTFNFAIADAPDVVLTRSFAGLDTLEVRASSRRHSARSGAIWGLYLGAAAGLIGGPFYATSGSMETGTAVGVFGSAGGLAGALTGAAVGALLAPERWYRYVVR